MKTPERERLLADVLHDQTYLDFRAQLRQTMLGELRRQRRAPRAKQLLALAACVALVFGVQWILTFRHPANVQPTRIAVIRSVPLKSGQIVTTAGHASSFAMVQSHDLELSSVRFGIVETRAVLPADTLSDEQLLDLFKGRAVALVSSSRGKQLLFLDEPQPDSAAP
jgi:hypothetical protein